MSAPTLRRWVCPTPDCAEPAKLAPERARADDTRTYCLPCSEKTGRLVRRVAPVVEAKRADARAARERVEAQRAEKRRANRTRLKALRASAEARALKAAADAARPVYTGKDIREDTPVAAQIAASLYMAMSWFHVYRDIPREAAMHGFVRVDASAPGLFPPNARELLDSIPRSPGDAPMFAWTILLDALDAPGLDFAEVREGLIDRIRGDARSHLQSIADEIESVPL